MTDRDEPKDSVVDLNETARRVADLGRETASKTTEYVRGGLDRATEYAQDLTGRASERLTDLTGRASERLTDLTGRPPETWARELRQFVEHSPVKALVIAVVAGYLLGRAVRRD